MEYEDFLKLTKERRSIRKFKPDPVSDEDIKKIIDPARYAPSGFNSQPWEFCVIKKPELKEAIAELISSGMAAVFSKNTPQKEPKDSKKPRFAMPYEQAPIWIIVMGDTRVRQLSPIPPIRTDEAKWTSVFIGSLAIAYQYAALAAVSLGLASHWVSSITIPSVESEVKKLLGIPEEMKFFDMLAVGYPDITLTEKKVRALEEIIHYDDCGEADFRTDELVRAYFGK